MVNLFHACIVRFSIKLFMRSFSGVVGLSRDVSTVVLAKGGGPQIESQSTESILSFQLVDRRYPFACDDPRALPAEKLQTSDTILTNWLHA